MTKPTNPITTRLEAVQEALDAIARCSKAAHEISTRAKLAATEGNALAHKHLERMAAQAQADAKHATLMLGSYDHSRAANLMQMERMHLDDGLPCGRMGIGGLGLMDGAVILPVVVTHVAAGLVHAHTELGQATFYRHSRDRYHSAGQGRGLSRTWYLQDVGAFEQGDLPQPFVKLVTHVCSEAFRLRTPEEREEGLVGFRDRIQAAADTAQRHAASEAQQPAVLYLGEDDAPVVTPCGAEKLVVLSGPLTAGRGVALSCKVDADEGGHHDGDHADGAHRWANTGDE